MAKKRQFHTKVLTLINTKKEEKTARFLQKTNNFDQTAIDLITDNDLDGFKAYLAEDDTLYFTEPETFATEEQALAFCSGIGYGIDERAPIDRLPLRSCEPADVPFIELIKQY